MKDHADAAPPVVALTHPVGSSVGASAGTMSAETTCSSRSRDLDTPDSSYRLVLRCTCIGSV